MMEKTLWYVELASLSSHVSSLESECSEPVILTDECSRCAAPALVIVASLDLYS